MLLFFSKFCLYYLVKCLVCVQAGGSMSAAAATSTTRTPRRFQVVAKEHKTRTVREKMNLTKKPGMAIATLKNEG
jgi:hypothetical protein